MTGPKKADLPKQDGNRAPAPTLAVPSGRGSRLMRLGWMATGIAGGMMAEGARQLALGNRPKVSDLLLTPANVRRVADQLAKLRGAAMKVGQLVSMESGDLLPPALAEILGRLRSDARAMPKAQVTGVLLANWGKGWEKQFKHFSFTPLAAASIGQVHRAQTRDGRDLAVKIQYPGVRESIDSDVDNVAGLLRMSGLLPKEMDVKPLLREAKHQLHDEADYIREGNYLHRYGELLADAPHYSLPKRHADLTTLSVLAMDYVAGVPIEALVDAAQEERDRVMTLLFALLLREIFEFRLVQTDPNFANYQYDTNTQQLILLDFGATRPYKAKMSNDFRRLIKGAMTADRAAMSVACKAIGYFDDTTQDRHQQAVLDIGLQALEPFCREGGYDFGTSDLPERVRSSGMALGLDREFWQLPPADALLLQRKFGGLYLLAIRLKARVDVNALAKAVLFSHKHSL
ncbi:MAG: AarF/ABC1/UbiB kinase family protein [Rhodoferax sp.]|uniref:ABC1 kinase family protein n=1 Tax=Rhodoferax sp. TaxID=50421 RepID=UPI0026109FEE|nr:AarF/ABC1/UbiB kinase family protein [Rhodoferax sp.]MDD5335153.1 AarF/ABC1/UbiB kinase family protein [Rhodoferax sp.]